MNHKLIIFGTSEIASLAKYYFSNDSDFTVKGFTVDDSVYQKDEFEGLPIIPYSEVLTKFSPDNYSMHIALSYQKLNQLREDKYNQAKSSGFSLASYVSTKATVWSDLEHGDNCFILEDQTIQPRVKIGNNVMLWSGNHLGHGSVIGDHTYIASQVVISGICVIGKRCFLGVNSTLKDFIEVGDDVFIGMDSSITKNMKSGSVSISGSTQFFEKDDRRAIAIKKSYFKL